MGRDGLLQRVYDFPRSKNEIGKWATLFSGTKKKKRAEARLSFIS